MRRTLATYRHGRVEFDSPVDWPDGTRVEVQPANERHEAQSLATPASPRVRPALLDALGDPDAYGLPEELWPQTPEEINVLLQHMAAAEPLDLTPQERERIEREQAQWIGC